MRNIFIVNPKAGKGKGIEKFIENIRQISEKLGTEVEIYQSKSVGDAELFAARISAETLKSQEKTRVIACGGDGTLNEVLNGVIGNDNIAVGVMPIGTGNDFVRNFPEAGDFLSVEAQLKSSEIKCDAIRYKGVLDGKYQTRYCANMFNIGFDCNVVDMARKIKKYPLIAGSFAYLLSVLIILVKKKGASLKIEFDGEIIENGPVLLTAIANGCYCGGGVKSSPYASVQDGIMDANVIYNVSRMEFVKKFPSYSKGTHLELPDIEHIICAKSCRHAVITPIDGNMRLCVDGEIYDAAAMEFDTVPNAFNFLIPAVL